MAEQRKIISGYSMKVALVKKTGGMDAIEKILASGVVPQI